MHQRTGGRNRLNFNTALYLLRVVCTVLRVDLEIVALQMKCEEINQHYKKESEHFEFSYILYLVPCPQSSGQWPQDRWHTCLKTVITH